MLDMAKLIEPFLSTVVQFDVSPGSTRAGYISFPFLEVAMRLHKGKARFRKITVQLGSREVTVYANTRVLDALSQFASAATLYEGVKLQQLFEAFYDQGLKDGRREVIEKLELMKGSFKYLPPGRPGKSN
jgi:hypothetical protein